MLRAPAPDRGPRARPVRGDGRRPRRRPAGRSRTEGVRAAVQSGGGPGGGGGDIQFMLQGPDLTTSSATARRCAPRSWHDSRGWSTSTRRSTPASRSCRWTSIGPRPPTSACQITDAAEALRLLVGGDQVTTYNDGGEQYQVHLRAQEQNRGTAGRPSPGCPCPRRAWASCRSTTSPRFARGDAPATISRMARQRQVTLTANMLPGTSQAAVQQQIAGRGADPGHGARSTAPTSPAGRAS